MKRNIEALDKHLTQLKTNLNNGYYGGACFLICEALHELDIIKAKANGLERSSDECHIQSVTVSLPLSNEQILKGIQTSPRYQLPKEWLKNEHTNSNYMGGFLNAVKWMEGNAR